MKVSSLISPFRLRFLLSILLFTFQQYVVVSIISLFKETKSQNTISPHKKCLCNGFARKSNNDSKQLVYQKWNSNVNFSPKQKPLLKKKMVNIKKKRMKEMNVCVCVGVLMCILFYFGKFELIIEEKKPDFIIKSLPNFGDPHKKNPCFQKRKKRKTTMLGLQSHD